MRFLGETISALSDHDEDKATRVRSENRYRLKILDAACIALVLRVVNS
jgi:hypothetical protein